MPVTLILSDEVAGDIMKQITEGLTRRTQVAEPDPLILHAAAVDKTYAAVGKLIPGETIHVTRFSRLHGLPSDAVSIALQGLKKAGEVAMVQKGTWRKISSNVALAS